MRVWFMSYTYRLKPFGIEGDMINFGCCLTRDEHPLLKIERWNEQMKETRRMTLLHYHQLDGYEVALVEADDKHYDFEV